MLIKIKKKKKNTCSCRGRGTTVQKMWDQSQLWASSFSLRSCPPRVHSCCNRKERNRKRRHQTVKKKKVKMSSASTLQVCTGVYIYIYMYILSHFFPFVLKKKKKALLASMRRVGTKEKKSGHVTLTHKRHIGEGTQTTRSSPPSLLVFLKPRLYSTGSRTPKMDRISGHRKRKKSIYMYFCLFFFTVNKCLKKGRAIHVCRNPPKKKRKQSRYMNSGSCHSRGIQAPNAHKR